MIALWLLVGGALFVGLRAWYGPTIALVVALILALAIAIEVMAEAHRSARARGRAFERWQDWRRTDFRRKVREARGQR